MGGMGVAVLWLRDVCAIVGVVCVACGGLVFEHVCFECGEEKHVM